MSSIDPGVAGGTAINIAGSEVMLNRQAGKTIGDLRLGMPVDARLPLAGTGNPARLTVENKLLAPILSVDNAGSRFTFPGITVIVDRNTIKSTIVGLVTSALIEVYGIPHSDPDTVLATRIVGGYFPGSTDMSLVGVANNLTTTTFNVGNVKIIPNLTRIAIAPFPNANTQPNAVVPNAIVRVIGSTYVAASNTFFANEAHVSSPILFPDNETIALEGVVETKSADGTVQVRGTSVRPTSGQSPVVGARVGVRGPKRQGVIEATEFTVIGDAELIDYALQGEITAAFSDRNFIIRGEEVVVLNPAFRGGTRADLAVGRRVAIKARVLNGGLSAYEVQFLP